MIKSRPVTAFSQIYESGHFFLLSDRVARQLGNEFGRSCDVSFDINFETKLRSDTRNLYICNTSMPGNCIDENEEEELVFCYSSYNTIDRLL